MNILIIASGTRGDVQPVLAVAKGLQRAGHIVTMVAGSNFAAWVQSHGIGFVGTLDMEAMMQSEAGVKWVENGMNPRVQLTQMRLLLEDHWQALTQPILDHVAQTDLVLGGFTSEPFLETICAKFEKPLISLYLQPTRPTKSGIATAQPIFPTRESIFNRWIGQFAQRLLWGVAESSTNQLRHQLGLPPHTFAHYERGIRTIPVIHGVSRHVVPHASDWGSHIHTAGYWFLDESTTWQPPAQLQSFLEAGPPPVYIGFGSMSASEPQSTAQMVKSALEQTGQRGILAKGWSGVTDIVSDSTLFILEKAPHDWLFPRMSGVVHHGGAGTTAAGLRAGKATFIIPHMADQPFWGRRVHELGVGVKPMPRPKLTAEALARGIHQLTGNKKMQEKAQSLGEKIRGEDGVARAVALIQDSVPS
jgi:sterol 3beta-glucosyltransferase